MRPQGPESQEVTRMTFEQALDQESRVASGSKIDADYLINIEFTAGKLTNSKAVDFLQRHRQGSLTMGEHALFQRFSNKGSALREIIPSRIYEAYMFGLSIADDYHVFHLVQAISADDQKALNRLALSVFFYAANPRAFADTFVRALQASGYHQSTSRLAWTRGIDSGNYAKARIPAVKEYLESQGVTNVAVLDSALSNHSKHKVPKDKGGADYLIVDSRIDEQMTVPLASSILTRPETLRAEAVVEFCDWFIDRFMKSRYLSKISKLLVEIPGAVSNLDTAVKLISFLDKFQEDDAAGYEKKSEESKSKTMAFAKELRTRVVSSFISHPHPERLIAEFNSTELKDSPIAQEIMDKVQTRSKHLSRGVTSEAELLLLLPDDIRQNVRRQILEALPKGDPRAAASMSKPAEAITRALYAGGNGSEQIAERATEVLALAGLDRSVLPALSESISTIQKEKAAAQAEREAAQAARDAARARAEAALAQRAAEAAAKRKAKAAAKAAQEKAAQKRKKEAAARAEENKGKMDASEFEACVADAYGSLNIPPHLSQTNLLPIEVTLAGETEAYLELGAWREADTERLIPVENESLIGRLGVEMVRVTRSNGHFDIDLEFPEQDGAIGRFRATRLDAKTAQHIGQASLENEDLHAVVKTEGARMFANLLAANLDDTCKAANFHDVLMLLTIKDLPPVEAKPKPKPKPKPEAPKEDPETLKMKEFLGDNHEAFESFVAHLRDHDEFRIGDSLRNLISHVKKLAAKIETRKQVHHQGIEVEIQDGHKLSNHVSSVKIYDPVQTRQFLGKVGLKPEFIHVDLDMLKDSYHCVAEVISEHGHVVEIHACIVPPDNEVYIFGVDPTETFEDEKGSKDPQQEKKIAAAFIHLLLLSFRKVVDRDDDPDNKRIDSPKNGTTRKAGQAHINRIITDTTGTAYPLLVESWGQIDLEPEEQAQSSGEPVEESDEKGSALIEQTLSAVALEELHIALALSGACLHAQDAWPLLAHLPAFKDIKDRFPNSAFSDEMRRNLKVENKEVYVPIDDPALVSEVLTSIKEDRMLKQDVEGEDAREWFDYQLSLGEGRREAASEAFAFALKTSNPISLKTTPQFSRLCTVLHSTITDPTLRENTDKYAYLFERAFELALCSAPEGMDVSEEDVFDALLELSLFNPDKLFIPTSAAATMRNPYRYRYDAANAPEETIFKARDFEGSAELSDSDVVAIIDGNRARINSVNGTWLRGNNRSDRANLAAKIQDQHRSPDSGPQLNLQDRARALLVYEFEGESGPVYAYRYLDTARDSTSGESLVSIPAETKLMNFPRVQREITRAKIENATGDHTDFADLSRWSRGELLQLESKGIFELIKSGGQNGKRVKVHGMVPDSQLPIRRKKVVIFKGEQIGYRQFSSRPATYAQYQDFLYEQLGDEQLHPEMEGYDPKRAHIQSAIYELLGLAPSFRRSLDS